MSILYCLENAFLISDAIHKRIEWDIQSKKISFSTHKISTSAERLKLLCSCVLNTCVEKDVRIGLTAEVFNTFAN